MKNKTSYSDNIHYLEKVGFLVFLFLLLSTKVFFFFYSNFLPDEAYYWLWSKNIALSYFDHPPLATWLLTALLYFVDDKYFAIRILPVACLGITLIIIVTWHRYMAKRLDYWASLKNIVLFLSFPIYAIFFSISFPDYLLITLLFSSSFCLFLYFERNRNERYAIHYWYLGVLLFSLALLTKHNAILLGIGVLAYVLYFQRKIGGPSYGHLAASTTIICLFQVPVLLWNLNNDFATFSFHLSERLDQGKNFEDVFRNVAGFLLGVLIAFSPIFIFSLKNNYFLGDYSEDRKTFIGMSKFILLFSVAFCLFLSFFTNVLYYWLTPATVVLIPFLINILRFKIWQYLHIFYGIVISLTLVVNISVFPISIFFGDVDRETSILFGWEKIVEVVKKEKKGHGIKKVVFSDYRLGSLYIFYSDDFEADVIMEERRTQFDVWRKKGSSLGKSTLIIADNDFPIGKKISSNFENIEFIRDIEIRMGNKLVKKYQVFWGTNS